MKLVSTLDCVSIVDPAKFDIVYTEAGTKILRIRITDPFSLLLELNYNSGEFIVEFTGKILGEDYPQLISQDSIQVCFQHINELGYCIIDTEKIMSAEVVKCDVTKDVQVKDVPSLTKWIRGNVSNYQLYSCRLLRNGNLIIEKNVTSHKRKKRMTIYDKENEMTMSRENDFVADNNLSGKFNGVCRFELNLTSKQQIRDALGTTGNTLAEVLRSTKNPIYNFADDVIFDGSTLTRPEKHNWKNYLMGLVLKECNYDITAVEAKLREYYDAGKCAIPTKLKPYREMLANNDPCEQTWTKQKILAALQ